MSWGLVAVGVGTAVGGYLSYKGSEKQSQSIEKAAQSTEAWQKYLVALEERKYDDAARFRNIAYSTARLQLQQAEQVYPELTKAFLATYPSTMGLLRQDVLREPGTSQLFQQGVGNIAAGLAPYGVSPKGSAFQRMYTNLLGQDIENVRQDRFKLAGLVSGQPFTPNISPETGYPNMSAAGAAQSDYASLLGTQGAVTGGMYGSLGQTVQQLPMYYSLMKYLNPSGGGNVTFPGNVPAQGTPVTSGGGYLTY